MVTVFITIIIIGAACIKVVVSLKESSNQEVLYEATFLATLEQKAEIAISLCKQSVLTFAQLLAVLLANLHVQDSLTTKISETRIWTCFTKMTNHIVIKFLNVMVSNYTILITANSTPNIQSLTRLGKGILHIN